jgi:hypothetical protein
VSSPICLGLRVIVTVGVPIVLAGLVVAGRIREALAQGQGVSRLYEANHAQIVLYYINRKPGGAGFRLWRSDPRPGSFLYTLIDPTRF